MKKIFIFLICVLSFSLFSCASKDQVAAEVLSELNAPETLEIETENTAEITEKTESENNETKNKEEFPLPDEIEEIEITTLAPENIPENLESEILEEKSDIPEELIVIEDPLPEIEIVLPLTEYDKEDDKEDELVIEEKEEISVIDNEIDSKEKTENLSVGKEPDQESNESNKKEEIISNKTDNNEMVPVIDPEENNSDEKNNNKNEVENEKESITPSRSVTIKRKEYVDITYPGSGWIYMGATDGSKNLTYFGRALGTKDTTFSLQGRNAGTKILHFYKNDHLTKEYIDDYIEVVVLDEIGSNKTHIAAPAYKQPVPKKAEEMFYKQVAVQEKQVEVKQSETAITETDGGKNQISTINNDDEITIVEDEEDIENEKKEDVQDPETLLKEAQLLYNEKEYKAADIKINSFLKSATKKIDEGLFLKGQILEAKSEIKNIKNAIAAYEMLTKEFPASKYWDAANKRIVYLKRFYLEVR